MPYFYDDLAQASGLPGALSFVVRDAEMALSKGKCLATGARLTWLASPAQAWHASGSRPNRLLTPAVATAESGPSATFEIVR